MDLKQLEKKRAELDEKIKQARALEAKKARFSALIARLRPELLDFDEEAIKGLVIPQPTPTTHTTGETLL
jgi:hypothetical protein